jgi:hypothetical protein
LVVHSSHGPTSTGAEARMVMGGRPAAVGEKGGSAGTIVRVLGAGRLGQSVDGSAAALWASLVVADANVHEIGRRP